MNKNIIISLSFILTFFSGCDLYEKSNTEKKDISLNPILEKEKTMITIYKVQENLKPKDLINISNDQIADHWNLYVGYVNQTNKLNEELDNMQKSGQADSLAYADRRRRLAFEYNGMVLHEYYFSNLAVGKNLSQAINLEKAIVNRWGSFDNWLKDFINTGKTRGIGWAILYLDPTTKNLINAFVQDHELGNIAGYKPILVMDVWEHAYMVDHKAGGRPDYINAFIKNINWEILEERFNKA